MSLLETFGREIIAGAICGAGAMVGTLAVRAVYHEYSIYKCGKEMDKMNAQLSDFNSKMNAQYGNLKPQS